MVSSSSSSSSIPSYESQALMSGAADNYPDVPWSTTYHRKKQPLNFKKAAKYVALPPLGVWAAIKFSSNQMMGKLIGRMIVAGQDLYKKDAKVIDGKNPRAIIEEELKQFYHHLNKEEFDFDRFKVESTNKSLLDTVSLASPTERTKAASQRKYIIRFGGNGEAYESSLAAMQADAKALECTVIGFNYRGVANSTGSAKTFASLVEDGYSQVALLLAKGVRPENICLLGHSLGGAVATKLASKLHKQNHPVYLFNDRSFSSLTNVIVGWIRCWGLMVTPEFKQTFIGTVLRPFLWFFGKQSYTEESLFGKMLGHILKPPIKSILVVTGWEVNAAKAYQKIDEKHKSYVTVRTRKHTKQENEDCDNSNIKDDVVITDYASLHSGLKEDKRAIIKAIKNTEKYIANPPQKYKDKVPQLTQQLQELKLLLASLKARKFTTHPDNSFEDAHDKPLKELFSQAGHQATVLQVDQKGEHKNECAEDMEEQKRPAALTKRQNALTFFRKFFKPDYREEEYEGRRFRRGRGTAG